MITRKILNKKNLKFFKKDFSFNGLIQQFLRKRFFEVKKLIFYAQNK